jgi:hypothetical protein
MTCQFFCYNLPLHIDQDAVQHFKLNIQKEGRVVAGKAVSYSIGLSIVFPFPISRFSLSTFVHEVLKRSRTFGSIMQTALCYLEAVHSKEVGR